MIIIHTTILSIGLLISVFAFVILPSILNTIILSFFIFALILKYIFERQQKRSWGTISSAQSNRPLDLATIRVFASSTNKLIQTKVSNDVGRFFFLLENGNYRLIVNRFGYQQYESNVEIKKEGERAVKLDIKLMSNSK